MKNLYGMNDKAIISELGNRLKAIRLEKNLTQEDLSKITGLDRTTISFVEQGRTFNILTLIEIMRGLKILDQLNLFLSDPGISPLDLAKLKGKPRKRASRSYNRKKKDNN